ncbi:MAG: DUF4823 domain-containing protein [Rhodocyclaceae bacterium]|nr:DUF4823 domain-containing protein [Rhodocyclaceae bacterium]
MNIFRLFLTALILASAGGCADSHQIVRYNTEGRPRLSPDDAVYIAVSRDGVYGNKKYAGSGLTTAQVLLASFGKRSRAEVAHVSQPINDALRAAREGGYTHLVFPTILVWEDRATEWSGIPDKVEVKIEIYELAGGKRLDSLVVKGKSGIATFGGDHPQDLLPVPIEEYVATLYPQ